MRQFIAILIFLLNILFLFVSCSIESFEDKKISDKNVKIYTPNLLISNKSLDEKILLKRVVFHPDLKKSFFEFEPKTNKGDVSPSICDTSICAKFRIVTSQDTYDLLDLQDNKGRSQSEKLKFSEHENFTLFFDYFDQTKFQLTEGDCSDCFQQDVDLEKSNS